MKIETDRDSERVSIEPEEFYSTGHAGVISTLLGSCIAACLYDPRNSLIGMNHFMLIHTRYSKDMPIHISEAGRYGIQGMELLINEMMGKGTNRQLLRAKVFGGATLTHREAEGSNFFCLGEVNCKFIREYLESENIPIEEEDLGGSFGREIHFSNGDFAVDCRKIGSARSKVLAKRDYDCWQAAIERQKTRPPW